MSKQNKKNQVKALVFKVVFSFLTSTIICQDRL
eukprot:COSAG06_NODE_12023_length_1433_cov_11.479112_2_plen_32_part_01